MPADWYLEIMSPMGHWSPQLWADQPSVQTIHGTDYLHSTGGHSPRVRAVQEVPGHLAGAGLKAVQAALSPDRVEVEAVSSHAPNEAPLPQWAFVSEKGAQELSTLRVRSAIAPVGLAPIEMLARVPSDECGCPEELWRIDGFDLLFHFEADGTSEAFLFTGDDELQTTLLAATLDDLRAKAFGWYAAIMATAKKEARHG